MDYIQEIYKLSTKFYKDYGSYKEILTNDKRSYNCLILKSKEDYFICVPFRSEITHKNAYLFKNTKRSQTHKSGLDYTKIILIKDIDYIGTNGLVDNDEYVEMMQNIQQICQEVNEYIDGYINHIENNNDTKQNTKKYKYTTLKYFHEILKI